MWVSFASSYRIVAFRFVAHPATATTATRCSSVCKAKHTRSCCAASCHSTCWPLEEAQALACCMAMASDRQPREHLQLTLTSERESEKKRFSQSLDNRRCRLPPAFFAAANVEKAFGVGRLGTSSSSSSSSSSSTGSGCSTCCAVAVQACDRLESQLIFLTTVCPEIIIMTWQNIWGASFAS